MSVPSVVQRDVSTPPDMTVDSDRTSRKILLGQWSLPSPPQAGKTARANDSFRRKEFFNARLYLGNDRRRTWDGSAILGIGICCRARRRGFSGGNTRCEYYRVVRYRILCRFHGPGRVISYVTAASSILHDRRLWRLHNVFILQPTNTRSRSRWRLVQRRCEHAALICLLPCCRMAWTHFCSGNIAEIKTTYAPS